MANEPILEGFDVFVHDGNKAFGAVRQVSPHGRPEIVIYVENAGDFTVPITAVKAVDSGKVVLQCGKLDLRLRRAIGHAHEDEDPRI
jgi:hypothetical protein